MVVEIRDWCQNVGEYNTYNFCIWHFGLCVIVSKIDRCRSSDPPYEIAINPIFRSYHVSDVIIQSFLNRSRLNLVHTLVARRARSAISDCLVIMVMFGGGGVQFWWCNNDVSSCVRPYLERLIELPGTLHISKHKSVKTRKSAGRVLIFVFL